MSLGLALRLSGLAALVAIALGLYAMGFSAGGNRELARASAQAIAIEHATTASTRAQLLRLRAQALKTAADNQLLERQLGEARKATRIVYRNIRKEIPHASKQTRPEAADGIACHLDIGPDFVELWDLASDPARASADATSSAAGVAAGQATEAGAATRVDLEALLQNHIDNAELATEAREQLEALIDWHLNTAEAPRE